MPLSTTIYGLTEDEEIEKIKTIINYCNDLCISIPEELKIRLENKNKEVPVYIPYKSYGDDYQKIYDVDLTKILRKIKVIRFTNKW